ncbi:MAG: C40 family peptidase [Clostridia bacterium]|nr:C40 family peptidase [Clostridia bacterium]
MDRKEKADILLKVAKAYMDRGHWLQYDQLSLDRIVRCTARRNAFAPPEAAAEGRYLFLDCAAFVWDCYYQAFDCRLEADMVINMIDHMSARVFYYELTHEESDAEKEQILKDFRACLQPGDIICYEWMSRAAHTMLYLGDGMFIHCMQAGSFNGYHYGEMRNIFNPEGGLRIASVDRMTRNKDDGMYLFASKFKRFSVNRPLDVVGDPTRQAIIRATDAADLYCSAYPSVGCGHAVSPGGTVSYEVEAVNRGKEAKRIDVAFEAGEGTQLLGAAFLSADILPGESYRPVFTVKAERQKGLLGKPLVTVNGLEIYVPDVAVSSRVEGAALESPGAFSPEACQRILKRLFFLHDTAAGDVLSRRPPDKEANGSVYGLFGGFGVITPQIAAGGENRAVHIDRNCLEPGDIILCADDALMTKCYSAAWDGASLAGSFECGEAPSVKSGEDADRWIDTLFGRFCFAVIRPSYLNGAVDIS